MSSSIVFTGFDTVNGGIDDDKFELQFALRNPVVDHQSLENHSPTSRPGFSIRGFVAQVRSKDISKCWPFSERLLQLSLKEGRHSLLPPLDSPQRGTTSGPERLCEAQFTVPLIQDSQEEKEDDINGGLQENQPVIITVENEDLIKSQITKADSLEAEECSDIVREDSSTAVKAWGRPPLECNDAVSNGHCDHGPLELSDSLAEVPITEISNANGKCWKKNGEVEDCDIGDATKKDDGAGYEEMRASDLAAKECPTPSSTINSGKAHTDSCLSISIKENMSSKSKAQKKRRSIADIFACAPPVSACGIGSSSDDVFVRSCRSPPLPLPLHCTDVLCSLDSAKVNPLVSAEMIDIPPPPQPQVGSKSKRKKRRASAEERHGPCSSSATRLKDMIKSIVKHPRKETSFLKLAKEPCKSADDVDEVNPNGRNPCTGNSIEAEELADPAPKKKKRQLSGNSSKILKRKRIKTLAFQHSPKDQHVGTSENVQSYVEMQGLENKSNGLPRPNDAKKRKNRSSIIKKKQEPAKKQKPDIFLRDSKGRFAKITAVDSAKHVLRKGYRKLRRQKQGSLKECDSSVHKDTNFAINLALSNARLGFLSDKAQTPTPSPSPCIDANTNIIKSTEIPDLNAADDTDQDAFATPEKRQADSALELGLHRRDSLQIVNTLSREYQSIGLGIVAQSSVAESNDRCNASSLATDPDKLHLVNRMNLASTETAVSEGMLLSHQKVQRACSQIEKYNCNSTDELLSVTHASRPDCQALFLSSSPQADKSVLGCQETTKVVRLMGKSLVIDTESVPQLNDGHTGFYAQPGATHRSKPLFENPSPTNRDRDTNELDLLQALESKQHCTAEEQGENPNNQFPEDLALSQPMKQHTTPPLRSKPVWLPGINAAISGRRSDFPRSRLSGESDGIPRGYGGEKIGVRDDGSRSPVLLLGRRDSSSLSQSTVLDRSAHSIYSQDLSTPCGYLVRDEQPQNATFPAARYTSAATIGPSTFRNMHDQETVCIARDSKGVNLPSEPNMDVVFPVCVFDANVLPRIEPPGRFVQTSNNASFAYRDCHEGRLKYGKERGCVIEDGTTVNLIDKLHGGICKDVVAGADQDGRSGFSGNQVESASASQVDPSTVIDLTNDSEEENNETGDDTSRVRSAGKRHVRFVEADRFQPNRRVVFANNRIQGQPRKLSGGAKHILKPSTYSSPPNIRSSALHYIFPFALEGKSMYLDH